MADKKPRHEAHAGEGVSYKHPFVGYLPWIILQSASYVRIHVSGEQWQNAGVLERVSICVLPHFLYNGNSLPTSRGGLVGLKCKFP